MKILCVSDQIDPLIYNQNALKQFPDIDVILCAGDLPMDYIDFIVSVFNKPTYFIFGNHNLKEFQYYHRTRVPVQTQAFDFPPAEAENGHGAIYAGFRVIKNRNLVVTDPVTGKKTPLLIAGVSGSLKYNNGLNQYTDTDMYLHLLALVPFLLRNKIRYGRYVDIFLTHAPPLGIHDQKDPCHRGFKCFLWFINKFKPFYLIHGHIHIYDQRSERVTRYHDTTIVNAFEYCILNFPPELPK
jgi:uncharacterized protein